MSEESMDEKKTVSERPKLDDFEYKLTTDYSTYCLNYDNFCVLEQKLKETERGSAEYDELIREAWKAYMNLLQWYHLMVWNASITVGDVRSRLVELGVTEMELWRPGDD